MKTKSVIAARATGRPIALIGVCSGRGGHDYRSADGPRVLQHEGILQWARRYGAAATWEEIRARFAVAGNRDALHVVADVCAQLARATSRAISRESLPIVLGGDHSCAIGTWSGIYAATRAAGPIGLIWIDAHMDSHVPATSPSGNYHGMPVAHLLGYGAAELTALARPGPALLPQNICLIGPRSFEPEEPEFLGRLGVKVFTMEEVNRRGLDVVFAEAYSLITANTAAYGISIDLDAFDPSEVPGTGSPVPGGIRVDELLSQLVGLRSDPCFAGLEIVEYNPFLDRNGMTSGVVKDLLHATLTTSVRA